MGDLQQQILALPSSEKLQLISFIANALKEDEVFERAFQRKMRIDQDQGTSKLISLEDAKSRLYGKHK